MVFRSCCVIGLALLVSTPTALSLPSMRQHTIPSDNPPATLANWQEGPQNRWAFRHTRRLLPTAEISRGSGPMHRFERNQQNLDDIRFEDVDGKPMTVRQMLETTYTDGFLVLHRSVIVTEQYFNGMAPNSKHLLMSVSKSFTGSLAGILVDNGGLDPEETVVSYVPELRDSAYGDATVRNLLDMTIGVAYSEDYYDPDDPYDPASSSYLQFDIAAGWRPRGDLDVPVGLHRFLQNLQKEGEHGRVFEYASPNTDALGWVLERAAKSDLAELFSRELWSKLGAEEDAYIILCPLGAPIPDGGINVTLRDLARFGQMHLQGGFFNDQQIVPLEWIEDFRTNGNREAWARSASSNPSGSYRSNWWISGNDHGAYSAFGIHGQMVYVDPAADMVIAKLSSQPTATSRTASANTRRAAQALAERFAKR